MTLTLNRSESGASSSSADTLPTSHFLFFSSCPESWGGSEELWSTAARKLAVCGHRVTVCKTGVVREHPRIVELAREGIVVHDYLEPGSVQTALALGHLACERLLRRRRKRVAPGEQAPQLTTARSWKARYVALLNAALAIRVKSIKPDFAVISQGENFDGAVYAEICREAGIPYVLISQKASDLNWPTDATRGVMLDAFRGALASYFVSKHNQALTERQIALRLPNAEIVRNPFLTPVDEALPYPDAATESGRLRLACVARLFALDKGQDTLLDVLAQDKWRRRNVDVDFYGQGVHRTALEQAARMLDLQNVAFHGHTDDITAIWRTHHALVLASRCEGLPLVIVEAMLCGRPVIVTNAGGNGELVDDGETGFIASGIDAESLDEAMERAWDRRADWERMGKEAAERVRRQVPADPGGDFAMKLTSVFNHARREGASHRIA